MFLLSLCSHPKEQDNKVFVLIALQYRPYKLHVLEQTIYVTIENRSGNHWYPKEVANEKVKATGNLNTGTL